MDNPSRRPVIAGNWKMNTTREDAVALARAVVEMVGPSPPCQVILIPPTCLLEAVGQAIGPSPVDLGCQNFHPERSGAYTGEVSGPMLRSLNVTHVLCGHSERRHLFGESSLWVGEKVAAAHAHGLTPILCVGETLDDREAERTRVVVLEQLDRGLSQLDGAKVATTVIAYEPVWAIGTGRTATPGEAQEVHALIRQRLAERFGSDVSQSVPLQYGGSVKPQNAQALLGQPDIDGALVGGASLDAASFAAIVGAL